MHFPTLTPRRLVPGLLALSLVACEEPDTPGVPFEGLAGFGPGGLGGSPPGDGGTATRGETGGSAGAVLHAGGIGGMGGGMTEDPVGLVTPPAPGSRGSSVEQQLELVLDGETVTGDLTWEVIEGELPEGVTLSEGGVLSGSPSQAGVFEFRVRVSSSDSITIADVGWEITGTRWLAYAGSADAGPNLYLLDTALAQPVPMPLFSPDDGVQKILSSQFSPHRGRYLSVLTQVSSGTQAYLVDLDAPGKPELSPITHPNSTAVFWSESGSKYGYTVRSDDFTSVFVDGQEIYEFPNVEGEITGARFLDERHVIFSTFQDGTATAGVTVVEVEKPNIGKGTLWGDAGHIDLLGPVGIPSIGKFMIRLPTPANYDYFTIDASGGSSYVTSGEAPVLLSPDHRWIARIFPAGAELENHVSNATLQLSVYQDDAQFAPFSRWFGGVREWFDKGELVLVDLAAPTLRENTYRGSWGTFHGFCQNPSTFAAPWAAATSEEGSLHFLKFGPNGDQLPQHLLSSPLGDLDSVQAFTCTFDAEVLAITGTTSSGQRSVQLYDANARQLDPRNLLSGTPDATLLGLPVFSPDSDLVALQLSEDGAKSLVYTQATHEASELEEALCGKSEPCSDITWFEFRPLDFRP